MRRARAAVAALIRVRHRPLLLPDKVARDTQPGGADADGHRVVDTAESVVRPPEPVGRDGGCRRDGGSGRDGGVTLVEVAVSAAVMAVAMAIFTTAIVQIFRTVNKVDALSSAQTQVAVAFQRLDKEVRYASAVSTPAQTGGDSFVEYVLSTLTTNTCVQLRLRASTGQLMRRTWSKDAATVTPTGWALLLSSVSSSAPFALTAGDTPFTPPILTINVQVTAGAGTTATTRETAVAIAALNAVSAQTTQTVCTEGRSLA